MQLTSGCQCLLALLCLLVLFSSGCSSLPSEIHREASKAFTDTGNTSLGQLLSSETTQNPTKSGFLLLDTGREALRARLALFDMAEQAIDLQYYIWNSDSTGYLLADRLLRAADSGVRVRLLLDDFNIGDRDLSLVRLDAHPNVEVRLYNPNASRQGLGKWLALLGEFGRLNQRMHNKSFIVDGSAAIVGGRNIGDEYFDLHTQVNFRDRDLLAVGPVVPKIAEGFDSYWNSERAYPITTIADERATSSERLIMRKRLHAYLQEHEHVYYPVPKDKAEAGALVKSFLPGLIWADALFVYDRPSLHEGDARKQVADTLRMLALETKREVLIESAYLILGDEGLELSSELTARNVSIRALTNSLASNDLTTNHSGYARRRPDMLKNGMELFEFRPDAASCQSLLGDNKRCGQDTHFGLHAKSIVFDREVVFVGSFNLNLRSVFLNTETALIVHSPELAARIATDIEENMKPENSWRVILGDDGNPVWIESGDDAEIRYFHEPTTGFWRRLKSGFLSWFPIEKYL